MFNQETNPFFCSLFVLQSLCFPMCLYHAALLLYCFFLGSQQSDAGPEVKRHSSQGDRYRGHLTFRLFRSQLQLFTLDFLHHLHSACFLLDNTAKNLEEDTSLAQLLSKEPRWRILGNEQCLLWLKCFPHSTLWSLFPQWGLVRSAERDSASSELWKRWCPRWKHLRAQA